MVELKFGWKTIDLPYTIYVPDVTEEMFDELVDEDTKAELLDGVMIVHSPASPPHNRTAGFLRNLMDCFTEERNLGSVYGPDDLVHLATCRKFAPDVFFLQRHRVPRPLPTHQFETRPDLLIEVLSSSNRRDDLEDKRPAYREARIGEIWFVDRDEQQIIIDRLGKKTYRTSVVSEGRIVSSVVEGFWVDAAWLWTDPHPGVVACLRKILKTGLQ